MSRIAIPPNSYMWIELCLIWVCVPELIYLLLLFYVTKVFFASPFCIKLQKVFVGRCTCILGLQLSTFIFCNKHVPENLDTVPFLITKDKSTAAFIGIKSELHLNHCNQSRNLFSKICDSTGQIKVVRV